MNKKAYTFVPIVLIFLIISLFIIVNGAHFKYQSKKDGLEPVIGMHALAIIRAYQEQEEALMYLDNAARIAVEKAVTEAGERGGLEESSCGETVYNLWNNDNQTCFPEINESFKNIFSEMLGNEVSGYSSVRISSNHDILMKQNGSQIELEGKTPDRIILSLTIGGEAVEQQLETGEARDIPAETIEQVNQYNDIFERASQEYRIEAAFLKAIVTQESRGDRYAISPTGCAGLPQFCYGTAKDYFDNTKDLVLISTSNICTPKKNSKGNTYTYECPQYILNSDPRFNPEEAIFAEANYLSDLSSKRKIKELTDNLAFTAASYNGGYGLIAEAIDQTGKDNPSWEEVAAELDLELMKKFSPYKSWSDEQITAKIDEIKIYVSRISGYFKAWGGISMLVPSIAGTFEFKQNFRTDTTYNLSVYDELKAFAEEAIEDCTEDIEDCLDEKISEHNKKNNSEIMYMEDCEKGPEKVFYNLLAGLEDCMQSWGDNCMCQITKEYNKTEMEDLEDEYKIIFEEEETGQIEPYTNTSLTNKTPETYIVMLEEPKKITKKVTPEEFIWMPSIYQFEYKDELENKHLIFNDQISGNNYWLGNFKSIYLVRMNNITSLWVDFPKNDLEKEGESKNLINPIGDNITFNQTCPVAKQVFRLCAKTKDIMPQIKDDGQKKELVFEEVKIKFALTLTDNTAPAEAKNLEAEYESGNISMVWEDESNNSIEAYEITLSQNSGNITLENIGSWTYFTSAATEQMLVPDETETQTLYYELIGNETIKYSLKLDPEQVLTGQNYTISLVGIDNFQNRNNGTKIMLTYKYSRQQQSF